MSAVARPVYIRSGREPVLALRHDAAAGSRRQTAVLLLGPFGWQGACSARALRGWALRLAAAGHPTVRIDLPGTGDSGGSPRDPELVRAWVGAVRGAAQLTRSSWECPRLCVVGVELGGLLAALALSQGTAIDDLILWAVPPTGRALLRQWRVQASMIAARHSEDQREEEEGVLALAGFALSLQAAQELGSLALDRITIPLAPQRALVLARQGLRGDLAPAELLSARGIEVELRQTDDYDALVAHPQQALAPHRTITRTLEWLARAPACSGAPSQSAAPAQSSRITLGAAVVESPLAMTLGGEAGFGVLSAPAHPRPELAGSCAVLFNAGALSHIGPNRMWVQAARAWAARGIATVRVDLPGLGEAGGDERSLVSNPALYGPERHAQSGDVLDALRASGIGRRFVLGGLCAGANWALRAALGHDGVAGVLAVNLYCVCWDLDLVDELETMRALRSLRGSAWRRLARGDVSEDALLERVRTLRVRRLHRALARSAQRRQWQDAQRAFDRLRDRGTHVQLLFSRSEPLAALLRRGLGGASAPRSRPAAAAGVVALEPGGARWPNVALAMLPTRDHMFRALWAQRQVHALLEEGLWRSLAPAPHGASSLVSTPAPQAPS